MPKEELNKEIPKEKKVELKEGDAKRLKLAIERVDINNEKLEHWGGILAHELDHEMAIAPKTDAVVSAIKARQKYLDDKLKDLAKGLKVRVPDISTHSTIFEELSFESIFDPSLGKHVFLLSQIVELSETKKTAEILIKNGVGVSYIESENILVLNNPQECDKIKNLVEKEVIAPKAVNLFEPEGYDDTIPEGFVKLEA